MNVDQAQIHTTIQQQTPPSFVFHHSTDIKSDIDIDLDLHDAMTTAAATSTPTTTSAAMAEVQPPTPILADMSDATEQQQKITATSMAAPQSLWTTPTSQGLRPRPATIHEGFSYCMGEAYDGLTSWDSSTLSIQQTPSDTVSSSRPISMHQDFYPSATLPADTWATHTKPMMDDSLDLQLDSDMGSIGQAYTTDEAIPILDLRYTSGNHSSGGPGHGGNNGGNGLDSDPLGFDGGGLNPRRLSGSSFTMSTTGGLSDMPSYEDFSAALSDAPSFSSDYPPPSNRNSLMSSTQLSPVASPRMTPQSRSELVRTQSRGRASPSPRPGLRAAPYSMEGPRNKRWSTGSYGTMPSRRPSPYMYHGGAAVLGNNASINPALTSAPLEPFGPRLATAAGHQSSPTAAHGQLPLNMGNLQQAATAASVPSQNPFFLSATPQAAAAMASAAAAGYSRHSMLLPTQLPSQAGAMAFHHPHVDGGFPGAHHFATAGGLVPHTIPSHHLQVSSHMGVPSQHALHHHHHHGFDPSQPAPLLSHGLFRMLQSNGDPHALHHNHYTDLSDPPDLYASLHEEQLPPPPEDMNPSDPDLVPHEQELRFTGDLYTPRWVRGHGNKREGWCGICKPGRWLVLKNSAFWYDKSFTHGISAATGNPFQEPLETRRMDGNPDVWEGLCGSCNDWIALVSSKKKGTTWFRHAYKCHTHPKIKDAPKRRRESSHTRVAAVAAAVSSSTSASLTSLVKSRPNSQCGPLLTTITTTATPAPSGALPMPHTPLTPQRTPVPSSATLQSASQQLLPSSTSSNTATPTGIVNHQGVQVQMPVPVSMAAMTGLSSMPSAAEQMMVQQQHSSPAEVQQPSPPEQSVQQQQQPHPFAHLPPSHPPPSHPPPPVPPRSHLRVQQQQQQQQQHMAQMEAIQQHHHQQMQQQQQQQQRNGLQHVRPPPPPPAQSRQMMTPLASIEGLGNMI
ncbi:hypothetical protein SBRCBS47491_008738 [Sporothrix bragantina]|uniref:Transcription regulator Rua1 C-terminal domain-containing protein n=1 Tax=Sporothrix bragantina TaxID=671064 RepID=A0ABP0CP08_9PEZI